MSSASTAPPTIHVNDVGTLYSAEVRDQGNQPYNPSGASLMEFLFLTPVSNTSILRRPVSLVSTGTGLKQKWFLQYTVVPTDVINGLHQTPGQYSWQAHIKFPTGPEYYSTIHLYDVIQNVGLGS